MPRPLLLVLVPAALAAQVAPPSSAIFDTPAVHEIRLTFKEANWYDILLADYDKYPDNTPYREASIVWGPYQFDVIGVRFKGNSSYRGATTGKKPFRIKLNEFVKGQKIEGMASFGLSNAWNDPSFVREKPYYEMAAASGLPACRSNFAALYVNGVYWGLYILGEIVNGDFIKNHFAKADDGGNLYKASDPGANLAYRGENPALYQTTFSKESNEEANDWTDLIELARIFDQTPIAELPSKLEPLIDVDSFLRALALDNMTANLDSYVGMAQNYYLYRRASDKRWVWIPWDPSLAFGAHSQGLTIPQLRDLPLEWVVPSGTGGAGGGVGGTSSTRPIASKLWQVPQYKERYRALYREMVNRVMVPAPLIARMNELRGLIRPFVEKDTKKLVSQAQFDNAMTSTAATGAPAGSPPGLQPFIEGRFAAIQAMLDGFTPVQVTSTPSSALLARTAGAPAAVSLDLALALSGPSQNASFAVTTSEAWLSAIPVSGALPAGIRISAGALNLNPGTYVAEVRVTAPGATNSPLSIPVVLIVTAEPSLVADPPSLTLTSTGATLTQTIGVASTAGASPFTAVVAGATCANFLTVTPASGTTPALLTARVNPPPAGSASCSGRINVEASGLAPASVPVTISGPSLPGGQTPVITAIANAASYATGALAPGTIVAIFGNNLGPASLAQGTWNNNQLGSTAGGAFVTFDGIRAPVLYARNTQLGAIVPFEASGRTQVAVQVNYNGRASAVIQMPVTPASPGVFTTAANGNGQASIINQTGEVNAPAAPAARGSVVAIYLTGAGLVSPPGTNGTLGTPAQAITLPVRVIIGGAEADVVYKGAGPGSVLGLYQVNAVVPAGSATGSVPVLVRVGNAQAQPTVTMYVQ